MRRILRLGALAALTTTLLCLSPGFASAQSFSQRAVRIIVPFPPGGGQDVVADVRKVHLLGLEAAGVAVVCIVAAAQDSIASLIGKAAAKTVELGVPRAVDAWTLFALQHPKFVFWSCINDKGVCNRLKILMGDVLLRASKVLELYAEVASAVRKLVDGMELPAEVIYMRVREDEAARLRVRNISDLKQHPQLRLGLSQEFLGRADGWPGLAQAYGLAALRPTGLDHGIAYEAIAGGKIDLMDIYSTDAKIERFSLRVLEDDKQYFPRDDALLLYRLDLPQRLPDAWRALAALEGRIDAPLMIRMNAAAELEGKSFAAAAALLGGAPAVSAGPARSRGLAATLFADDFWRLTQQHLVLVFVSLAASILIGVPLGVVAARHPRAGQGILALVGVIQTIPALALLVFLIALMGTIGTAPTLVALSLYALLPIVRNTEAGLREVGGSMRRAAMALGLRPGQSLRYVELPLALPTLLAGVKTSAVINVGTATIAAFIGAGGYGERIATGLALNDNAMLLAGAIPAAVLALLVQGGFELIERWCNPLAGVKLRS